MATDNHSAVSGDPQVGVDANHNYHMTPDEFRKWGHALVDWVADYQSGCEKYPVKPHVMPGDVRRQLPSQPPLSPEGNFQNIMNDLDSIVIPGIMHWQSPNFFGYFPANSSGPSVLADLVCSGLGVQGMLWSTSPACTEIESHVMDWLVDLMNLPPTFKTTSTGGGVIQDGASGSVLTAICCARDKKTNFQSREQGICGSAKLIAYCSPHTHSSVEKALMVSSIGRANIRQIAVDPITQAMDPISLEAAIVADLAAGAVPFFVCATVGTTSTNAMDPLDTIGQVCVKYNLWLHVDAAMCGTAAICPEFRWIIKGLEYANSYCFNPHKWMFTNSDCSCFFVSDKAILIKTLSVLPEYLRNQATESGSVIDYRDWHIPLGRRFRSLKLWFVLRHYGQEGLQYHIRQHVALAQKVAQWIRESSQLQLFGDPPMNLVCFRLRNPPATIPNPDETLLNRVNATGKVLLTHTKVDNKFILRMCIGTTHTTPEHVQAAWTIIQEEATKILSGN
ncbi:aromatic-L-amino-acid decarboxylase [Pelomyxa schiedti]|nr:aromatic-L-amino-acid decarboxylase [Pelomyxa schiedti]